MMSLFIRLLVVFLCLLLGMVDQILNTSEVSRITNVPVATLRWWRHQGMGPRSFKLGPRKVMYRESDVQTWLGSAVQRRSGDRMSARVVRCQRCGKRMRRDDGWNTVWIPGLVVGHECPDCQTPQADLEAELISSQTTRETGGYCGHRNRRTASRVSRVSLRGSRKLWSGATRHQKSCGTKPTSYRVPGKIRRHRRW
jgi:predicted DNA-binding transcriptional regulator AlpA